MTVSGTETVLVATHVREKTAYVSRRKPANARLNTGGECAGAGGREEVGAEDDGLTDTEADDDEAEAAEAETEEHKKVVAYRMWLRYGIHSGRERTGLFLPRLLRLDTGNA